MTRERLIDANSTRAVEPRPAGAFAKLGGAISACVLGSGVLSMMTWDDELTAYQRGEFLQLTLTVSAANAPMRYVMRQWFVPRDNIHLARQGATRIFATEASARAFIARQHSALIPWAVPDDSDSDVVAVWRST